MTISTDLHHDHERADELLEAYLLGTLPAADVRWMREHIARCARCQAELAELLPAVQALPFAAPEPPVALSDTVWYRIEQAILRDNAAAVNPAPAPVPLRRAEPSRGLSGRQWLLVAALMLLSLIGGTVLGQVLPRFGEDDAGRTIAIQITDPSISATGELRYLPDEGVFILNVAGMPEPPPGHVYQAWLISDGNPVPAGVMNPALGEFASAGNPDAFQTFALTVEPGPLGNEAPTTDPVLVAQLDDASGS